MLDAAKERAPLKTRLSRSSAQTLVAATDLRPRHAFVIASVVALLLFAVSFVSTDARPPPPRHLSVLFLGDSVTVGAGASASSHTYASIVMERLRTDGFDTSDQVIISAFGGVYTDLTKAAEVRARAGNTDGIIVVEVGAHSVIENQSMPLAIYRRGYGMMLDCLLAAGAPVVVGTVPSLNWQRSDPLYARADAISSIIDQQAAARGIPVADVWNATRDRPDLVSGDGMHPNDEGHLVIADAYWQRVASAVHSGSHQHSTCPYATGDLVTLLR